MRNINLKACTIIICCSVIIQPSIAQDNNANNTHLLFPQGTITNALKESFENPSLQAQSNTKSITNQQSGAFQMIKLMPQLKERSRNFSHNSTLKNIQVTDTLFVGTSPHDTVRVTGTWSQNGPIIVFNDGVLIFHNANATIFGDLNVYNSGHVLADSSTLFFPQQYFYQRTMLAVQNSLIQLNDDTLNFGGMQHNLFAGDSSIITMNNVYNTDWTTAGTAGKPTITLNNLNEAGEYILEDYANTHYSHVNSLLLWHHFPDTAVVNYSFPNGYNLNTYDFNNTIIGISGIEYSVHVDTSTNVWWGMMPVNGSDITISNSTIRTIGLWFQHADTVNVSGLVDNSVYSNFTAPLADRTLNLTNDSLQTWSIYTFDISRINLTGSIVGEVGSEGRSTILSQSFFCDGSGGYFWAADTSLIISNQSSAASSVRSEKNGFMVFAYGNVNNGLASSIGKSILIVVQSSLPQDPVADDASAAWFANLSPLLLPFVDTVIPVKGSAWIDQGPLGSWMDFGHYELFVKPVAGNTWTTINSGTAIKVRDSILAMWNTHGLTPGTYTLDLRLFNNLGDSVDAMYNVTLLPLTLGINQIPDNTSINVYPNPATTVLNISFHVIPTKEESLSITDILGNEVYHSQFSTLNSQLFTIDVSYWSNGVYIYKIISPKETLEGKFVKTNK